MIAFCDSPSHLSILHVCPYDRLVSVLLEASRISVFTVSGPCPHLCDFSTIWWTLGLPSGPSGHLGLSDPAYTEVPPDQTGDPADLVLTPGLDPPEPSPDPRSDPPGPSDPDFDLRDLDLGPSSGS